MHGRGHVVILGTLAVALAAVPATGLAGRSAANRLVLESHGVSIEATASAECRPSGVCIDRVRRAGAQAPLPSHGGGTVVLRTGVRARRVSVNLYRHRDDFGAVVPVRALGRSRRRFAVTLPPGPPTGTLSTVVDYRERRPDGSLASGDALFVVGLDEHVHSPPQAPIVRVAPPAVTRRLKVRCQRPRRGWRYCDLDQRGRVVRPAGDRRRCWGGYVKAGIPYPDGDVVELDATTKPSCRYRIRGTFGVPGTRRSVVVRTDFLGDALLLPKSGRTVRVDLRSAVRR